MVIDSNNNSPIISDFSNNSKILVVTFGGIAKGIGIPAFEFFNILGQYNLKKIFIRDFAQSWYHKGLSGLSNNISETANLLKAEIEKSKAEKIIFLGNSSGGYAALLFGNLLVPDKVYCFAPQTFLSRRKRLFYFDFRWPKEICNVYETKPFQKEYMELRKKFKQENNLKTKYFIHYCNTFRLDRIHAEQLNFGDNITLVKYQEGGHGLIKKLKETGDLEKIIKEALI